MQNVRKSVRIKNWFHLTNYRGGFRPQVLYRLFILFLFAVVVGAYQSIQLKGNSHSSSCAFQSKTSTDK